MRSEFKNSVQIEKLWLISRCYKEAISIARFGVCIYSLSPIKGKSHKLSWYHEETVKKKEFALKNLAQTVLFHVNRRHERNSET